MERPPMCKDCQKKYCENIYYTAKSNAQIQCNAHQKPMPSFVKTEKSILKFIWKQKRS
jgi:hypothetical protein